MKTNETLEMAVRELLKERLENRRLRDALAAANEENEALKRSICNAQFAMRNTPIQPAATDSQITRGQYGTQERWITIITRQG